MNDIHNITVKKARRESALLRAISMLLRELESSVEGLQHINCTRVRMSPDSGMLHVYMHSDLGEAVVRNIIEQLKLYRPSIRSSLTAVVALRRTPDIRFLYDDKQDAKNKIESLIDRAILEDSRSNE